MAPGRVRRGLADIRFAFRTLQDRLPKELARAPLLLGPPHLDLQKADHAPERSRATRTGHLVLRTLSLLYKLN